MHDTEASQAGKFAAIAAIGAVALPIVLASIAQFADADTDGFAVVAAYGLGGMALACGVCGRRTVSGKVGLATGVVVLLCAGLVTWLSIVSSNEDTRSAGFTEAHHMAQDNEETASQQETHVAGSEKTPDKTASKTPFELLDDYLARLTSEEREEFWTSVKENGFQKTVSELSAVWSWYFYVDPPGPWRLYTGREVLAKLRRLAGTPLPDDNAVCWSDWDTAERRSRLVPAEEDLRGIQEDHRDKPAHNVDQ